jgi:hypothetical protein
MEPLGPGRELFITRLGLGAHGGAGSREVSALCIPPHFPDSLGLGRFSGCESHALSVIAVDLRIR